MTFMKNLVQELFIDAGYFVFGFASAYAFRCLMNNFMF